MEEKTDASTSLLMRTEPFKRLSVMHWSLLRKQLLIVNLLVLENIEVLLML